MRKKQSAAAGPQHEWRHEAAARGACAFAVVLGGAALHGRQTGTDPVTDIAHTFGLVAYAAEIDEMRQPKESKIVFDCGSGVDDRKRVSTPAVCSR